MASASQLLAALSALSAAAGCLRWCSAHALAIGLHYIPDELYGLNHGTSDVELVEEYFDRAWDLFYGREGQVPAVCDTAPPSSTAERNGL